MSKPASATPAPEKSPVPSRSRRRWRIALVLLFLLLAAPFEPHSFRTLVHGAVKFAAWQSGAWVRIDRIEGSLFSPVIFTGSHWEIRSRTGARARMQFDRAEAVIAWRHLFQRGPDPWFRSLKLEGVLGKIALPLDEPKPSARPSRRGFHWQPSGNSRIPLPAVIEVRDIGFVFQSDRDYVRLDRCHISASENAPGEFGANRVTLRQPWLSRTFDKVRGTAALRDAGLHLGGIALAPGVEIGNLVADFPDFVRGRMNLELDVSAFGGSLRAKSATFPRDDRLHFEADGQFTDIAIAGLAAFLGLSEAAGGTIKTGAFSFRGPPRDLQRATARLGLEAVNFQWETRRWDSLIASAELTNGRLRVPQLDLHQEMNTLSLTGELDLPQPDRTWWKGEFNGRIKARIGNLTDLSALLLPEFQYAAGQVEMDGHVSGRGEDLEGQLLIEGRDLTWRNAPIESLHAALKLGGKEVRVSRVELVNGEDYLRGSGTISVFGPLHYSGDLRIAVEDLAHYESFLQKPILPGPLAGGAVIDWSGAGSPGKHRGKCLARLRKVRAPGEIGSSLHPIDADFEAAYEPGGMKFTRFALSDEESSFAANVNVGNRAIEFANIRLEQRGRVRLEGGALLPLDVWQQWPGVSLAQDVPARVWLVFHELNVADAARLSGWKIPIGGTLDGTLTAEGALAELQLGGELAIKDGRLPLDEKDTVLEDIAAAISMNGDTLEFTHFDAALPRGALTLGGTIKLRGIKTPLLALSAKCPQLTLPLFHDDGQSRMSIVADMDLKIDGPADAAVVRGKAAILSVALEWLPDLTSLWNPKALLEIPLPFTIAAAPWDGWRLWIECETDPPAGLREGTHFARIAGHLGGTAHHPGFAGEAEFEDVDAVSGTVTAPAGNELPADVLNIGRVVMNFPAHSPAEPSILLDLHGETLGAPFSAIAGGPLNHLMRTYESRPPMTDEAVRSHLAGTLPPPPDRFSLEVRPPIAADVITVPWHIEIPGAVLP